MNKGARVRFWMGTAVPVDPKPVPPDAARCPATYALAGVGLMRCVKKNGHVGRHSTGSMTWGPKERT